MRVIILLGLLAAALNAAPSAIVIRHDREEARYRALGQDTPSVVRFAAGGMSWQNRNGRAHEGRYGVEEHNARVSTFAKWISKTIGLP